jgi:hypothetical protein
MDARSGSTLAGRLTLASTLACTPVAALGPPDAAPPPSSSAPWQAPAAPERSAEQPSSAREVTHPELLDDCDARRSIVVHKRARELGLYCGDDLAARFGVSLGFAPEGDKEREGDGRTPEGELTIPFKFPSQFHRSLRLSYPTAEDADRGLAARLIGRAEHAAIRRAVAACELPPQNTALGSLIEIHGGGGGPLRGDWTLGCIALDNPDIDTVFAFVRVGCEPGGVARTRVVIHP